MIEFKGLKQDVASMVLLLKGVQEELFPNKSEFYMLYFEPTYMESLSALGKASETVYEVAVNSETKEYINFLRGFNEDINKVYQELQETIEKDKEKANALLSVRDLTNVLCLVLYNILYGYLKKLVEDKKKEDSNFNILAYSRNATTLEDIANAIYVSANGLNFLECLGGIKNVYGIIDAIRNNNPISEFDLIWESQKDAIERTKRTIIDLLSNYYYNDCFSCVEAPVGVFGKSNINGVVKPAFYKYNPSTNTVHDIERKTAAYESTAQFISSVLDAVGFNAPTEMNDNLSYVEIGVTPEYLGAMHARHIAGYYESYSIEEKKVKIMQFTNKNSVSEIKKDLSTFINRRLRIFIAGLVKSNSLKDVRGLIESSIPTKEFTAYLSFFESSYTNFIILKSRPERGSIWLQYKLNMTSMTDPMETNKASLFSKYIERVIENISKNIQLDEKERMKYSKGLGFDLPDDSTITVWKKTILGETPSLSANSVEDKIYTTTIIKDIELYTTRPNFAYKLIDKIVETKKPLALNNLLVGQKLNGKDCYINVADAAGINIFATSRAGKGVMTLSVLATLIGAGNPIVYADFKPDMSLLLDKVVSELAKEAHRDDVKFLAFEFLRDYATLNVTANTETISKEEIEKIIEDINGYRKEKLVEEQKGENGKNDIKIRPLKTVDEASVYLIDLLETDLPKDEYAVNYERKQKISQYMRSELSNEVKEWYDKGGGPFSYTETEEGKGIAFGISTEKNHIEDFFKIWNVTSESEKNEWLLQDVFGVIAYNKFVHLMSEVGGSAAGKGSRFIYVVDEIDAYISKFNVVKTLLAAKYKNTQQSGEYKDALKAKANHSATKEQLELLRNQRWCCKFLHTFFIEMNPGENQSTIKSEDTLLGKSFTTKYKQFSPSIPLFVCVGQSLADNDREMGKAEIWPKSFIKSSSAALIQGNWTQDADIEKLKADENFVSAADIPENKTGAKFMHQGKDGVSGYFYIKQTTKSVVSKSYLVLNKNDYEVSENGNYSTDGYVGGLLKRLQDNPTVVNAVINEDIAPQGILNEAIGYGGLLKRLADSFKASNGETSLDALLDNINKAYLLVFNFMKSDGNILLNKYKTPYEYIYDFHPESFPLNLQCSEIIKLEEVSVEGEEEETDGGKGFSLSDIDEDLSNNDDIDVFDTPQQGVGTNSTQEKERVMAQKEIAKNLDELEKEKEQAEATADAAREKVEAQNQEVIKEKNKAIATEEADIQNQEKINKWCGQVGINEKIIDLLIDIDCTEAVTVAEVSSDTLSGVAKVIKKEDVDIVAWLLEKIDNKAGNCTDEVDLDVLDDTRDLLNSDSSEDNAMKIVEQIVEKQRITAQKEEQAKKVAEEEEKLRIQQEKEEEARKRTEELTKRKEELEKQRERLKQEQEAVERRKKEQSEKASVNKEVNDVSADEEDNIVEKAVDTPNKKVAANKGIEIEEDTVDEDEIVDVNKEFTGETYTADIINANELQKIKDLARAGKGITLVAEMQRIVKTAMEQAFTSFDLIKELYIDKNGHMIFDKIKFVPRVNANILKELPITYQKKLKEGNVVEFFNFYELRKFNELETLIIEDTAVAERRIRNEYAWKGRNATWLNFKHKFNKKGLAVLEIGGESIQEDYNEEEYQTRGSGFGFGLRDKLVGLFSGTSKNNSYNAVYANYNNENSGIMGKIFNTTPVKAMTTALGWTLGLKATLAIASMFGPIGLFFGAVAGITAVKSMKDKATENNSNVQNKYSSNGSTVSNRRKYTAKVVDEDEDTVIEKKKKKVTAKKD